MTLELTGLKKVRERKERLEVVVKEYGIKPESTEWQARGAFELKEAEKQFQSDLRAIEAGLKSARVYGDANSDGEADVESYSVSKLEAVISAIHSAIEES